MNKNIYTWDDKGVYVKNLCHDGSNYGITQYRYPHNYELVGKKFTLVCSKCGREFALEFLCKKNLNFEGTVYPYEALKAGPKVYFVLFDYTWMVVDLNTQAVTFRSEDTIVYTTVKGAEGAAPHAPAGDEMVGTKLGWIFGYNRMLTQDFISEDRVKAAWSPRDQKFAENAYTAVKVGGPYYLVDMKTDVLSKVCAPFFTDHVVLLQDYDHCMAFGAIYGKGFEPMLVTGYARFSY